MKKLLLLIAFIATTTNANSFTLNATPYAEISIVKPLSERYGDEADNISKTPSSGYEVGIGWNFGNIEAGFHHAKFASLETNMIKGKFKLDELYGFTPFIGAGIGLGNIINTNALAWEVSGGFDTRLTDNVRFRSQVFYQTLKIEGKEYNPGWEFENDMSYVGVKLGVAFGF